MTYVERDGDVATNVVTARRGPNLVRWGAVFCGVVVALATMILLTLLWAAIAHNGTNAVSQHLNWFLAGTAIGVLLLGGLLAGAMSGARGVGVGLVNGLTVWALFVIGALATAIPGVIRSVSNATSAQDAASNATTTISSTTGIGAGSMLWPTFWALLIGAAVAGIGGILGGARKRRDVVAMTPAAAPVAVPTTAPPAVAPVARRHDVDGDGIDDRTEGGATRANRVDTAYPEEPVTRPDRTTDETAVYDNGLADGGRHRRD